MYVNSPSLWSVPERPKCQGPLNENCMFEKLLCMPLPVWGLALNHHVLLLFPHTQLCPNHVVAWKRLVTFGDWWRGYKETECSEGPRSIIQGPPKRIMEQERCKEAVGLGLRRAEGQSKKDIGEAKSVSDPLSVPPIIQGLTHIRSVNQQGHLVKIDSFYFIF